MILVEILWGKKISKVDSLCARIREKTPECKLYLNWKLNLFLNNILSTFHFTWFLDCDHSIDEQKIGFKQTHVDKTRIAYKNKGGGFQADEF